MSSVMSKYRIARSFAALSAATLLAGLPGVANADKLMLSEITVVAVAIETEAAPQAVTDELNAAVLANVKDQIEADTAAALDTLLANVEASVRDAEVSDES